MARHNELRDGVADLAEKAFTPAHVRNNTKLFTSGAVQGGGQRQRKRERHRGTAGEQKGYLMIWDVWTQGMGSIHDMHVVDTDAVLYQSQTPDKCLETDERKEKKN